MKAILEIENLEFQYEKGPKVLSLKNFSIQKGEKVFLRGPSGSGKTTLLNLVGGVLTAKTGRLEVLGKSLRGLSSKERDQFRANHMGFIFQMLNLIPYLSPVENITLPLEFSPQKRERLAARKISPEDEAFRLMSDLKLPAQQIAQRKVFELSVGQQQRLAVARSLMGSPDFLIADEPTSALDAEAKDAFLDLLLKECVDTTVLFVSHDPSLSGHFDRVVDLREMNSVSFKGEIL